MNSISSPSWTFQDSAELYRVADWSAGYLNVSETGELQINSLSNGNNINVSLVDIISGIRERDIRAGEEVCFDYAMSDMDAI